MKTRLIFVAPTVLLALLAALLWFSSPGMARDPRATIASPAAQSIFSIRASVPLTTPTPIPTTPIPPEPEYLILQYVINSNPEWTCTGPSGSPGHRYIEDCNPLPPHFSHSTTGQIDRFSTPADAYTAWQTMRTDVCPTYPICFDTYHHGFHGYEAGNENYPFAHYEVYTPASIWIIGAVSSDDTHFNGAPYISNAIFNAAIALGYITTGTVTPVVNSPTPTATATQNIPPDLTGTLFWVTSCPAPVMRITTHLTGSASSYAPPSTMHVVNNAGQTLDFAVPALQGGGSFYSQDCQEGTCMPSGWSFSIPITLTVDYNNTVVETNETNNTFVMPNPPPAPTPCGATPFPTFTLTTTPTVPTATPIPGCTIVFTDVPLGSTFYSFVRCLSCLEIVGGYPCGGPGEPCNGTNDPYYRPSTNISRGQLSKVVVLALDWQGSPTTEPFADVPLGSTFHPYIVHLYDLGYIGGYPCGAPAEPCDQQNRPYFRPNTGATRGQISKIVAQAANLNDPIPPKQQTFEDVLPASTFWLWIERIAAHAIVQGYPCGGPGEPCGSGNLPYFRPNSLTTRGQLAKIVSSTFFPGCQAP